MSRPAVGAAPGGIAVREAVPGDVPLILGLIRDLAAYEHLEASVRATEEGIRDLLFGPRPVAGVLIAEAGGRPAGFAVFHENLSTFLGERGLFLEDLFVRPECRRRGIGRRLLGEYARIALRKGCGYLEWRVLDWNRPAIEFYRGLGAIPLQDWTVFRLGGEDLERLGASP